jgi:hypothetical protein
MPLLMIYYNKIWKWTNIHKYYLKIQQMLAGSEDSTSGKVGSWQTPTQHNKTAQMLTWFGSLLLM